MKSLTTQLFKLILILVSTSIYSQGLVTWVTEGYVGTPTTMGTSTVYSFNPNTINNVNYNEGTDPFIWGHILTVDSLGNPDTSDFEIIVSNNNIVGNNPLQISINQDGTMDLQTDFDQYGLDQNIEIQFNVFERGTRNNQANMPGLGGIPKDMFVGVSKPNTNITNVAYLHSAELYYVENINSTDPLNAAILGTCNQLDTFITGLNGSDINTTGEDVDQTYLDSVKAINAYPYNISSGRTYFHAMEAQNTCDVNNNNRLETAEADYNIYFQAMSSFKVGRQDIKKGALSSTGVKSAIGFYLSPLFDADEVDPLPIELESFNYTVTQSNEVTLEWTTLSETNNKYFIVEYSYDAISWYEETSLEGAGTTTVPQYYKSTLNEIIINTIYLRLKQVDFNGEYSYSNTLTFTPFEYQSLEVFPNPSVRYFYINSRNMNITIYNQQGLDISKLVTIADETHFKKLDFISLPKGIYYIHATNDESIIIQKL